MRDQRRPSGLMVAGLFFLGVAAVAAWYATDHTLSRDALRFGVPAFLIALGLLGLTLSRRR